MLYGGGRRLLAAVDIPRGTTIMPYDGERLDVQALSERYREEAPQYVLHARRLKCFIDARDETTANEARFINHAVDGNRANVRYTECGFVRATRRIREGEELLAKYGAAMGRRVNDEVRAQCHARFRVVAAVLETVRSVI
jgi:SET domain-containing protein